MTINLIEDSDDKEIPKTRSYKKFNLRSSHLYRSLDHTQTSSRSTSIQTKTTFSRSSSTFYLDLEPTQPQLPSSPEASPTLRIPTATSHDSHLVVSYKNSQSSENLDIFFKRNSFIDLSSTQNQSDQFLNATKKFEEIFGNELSSKLICDNTNSITLFSDKNSSKKMANTIDHNLQLKNTDRHSTDSNEASLSDVSLSKSSSSSISPNLTANTISDSLDNASELLDKKKKQKLDEYYHIEEKQAKLLKILAKGVYKPLLEENKQQRLCETDEMMKVFYVVAELEQLATLVHEQVAMQIKSRVETEWSLKPFFGDILTTYYYYYRVYKAILERYPTCQLTLSILLKKPKFVACLKRLLDVESLNLEKVTRLDMLLDRIVDLPRRSIQLLESYLKLLDASTKEFEDIKKVLHLFTEIFESSNDALNKMNNFQNCYELQYMIEQPQREKDRIDIIDPNFPNRQLIKQGPLYKVAKRDGELYLRHLALFTDILLVCKCGDRFSSRKLKLNYKLPTSKLKLIENSDEFNELKFRIVSSDQNNEFKTDRKKDKDDWLKAFRKCKDIQIVEDTTTSNSSEIRMSYLPSKLIESEQIGKIPPIWIKDKEQTSCSGCNEQFTAFRRRHHCRTCGRIYCSSCCSCYIAVKFNDFKKKERVCRDCFTLLLPAYEEYAKSVEDPSTLLPPEQDAHITNKTIATVNDFLKNITSNNTATSVAISTIATMINGPNTNTNTNTSSISAQSFETNKISTSKEGQESNSSIDTLTKELDQVLNGRAINRSKNLKVIRRKRVDSAENLSSSPLNDEQLNFIKPFLDVDEPSNDSLSSSSSSDSDEPEVSLTPEISSSTNSTNFISPSFNEEKIKLLKPLVPLKPNLSKSMSSTILSETPRNDIMRYPDKEVIHREFDKQTQSAANFRKQSASNFHKEVICADFGYLCKIPIILNKSKSIENLASEGNSNTSSWSHVYFTLYSNSTIGVSANNNDINSPGIIIKLNLFQLKEINETTFGFDVIKNKTPSPERKSNDVNNNNNHDHHLSVDDSSRRSSINKITGIDSNTCSIKSKLKMFETNYELRFTNKASR